MCPPSTTSKRIIAARLASPAVPAVRAGTAPGALHLRCAMRGLADEQDTAGRARGAERWWDGDDSGYTWRRWASSLLPQGLEPEVDDLADRMKQIVARYRELRAQGTLPGSVAQQSHAALSNIEQRLSAPALDDDAAEPPILDTVARILELMADAAGGGSGDVPQGTVTHPSPDAAVPAVAPPEPPAALAGTELLPVPVNVTFRLLGRVPAGGMLPASPRRRAGPGSAGGV